MDEDKKYMVFRVYSKKERPNASEKERAVFFGWSRSKSVIKAFKEQRDKRKYVVHKMTDDDIIRAFSEDITDDVCTMIDYIKLTSVQTQEEVIFFSTANELRSAEIEIQNMMKELCSISDIPGNGNYLWMVLALDDYYGDALHYLGYRPPEIDIMFPSMSNYSQFESAEEEIDDAYDGILTCPEEMVTKTYQPIGLSNLSDVATKILYSLESFVKVLKDEL